MTEEDDRTSLVLPQDTFENGATVVVPSEEMVAAESAAWSCPTSTSGLL